MKPEEQLLNVDDQESAAPISGDVIGDTAYSERFVLKILLKFANLDILKDENQEKSFEDDLCTLWDMTAERDVVLFLQKHDVLSLFNFALPVIESPRIIEIIVGIISNMCCQKDVVTALIKLDTFVTFLLDYMSSDDSLILIQVLRFVSSCLFLADEEQIQYWVNKFESSGYSSTLYFILRNSSNKELLITALENLNTLTSYCNKEKTRIDYFDQFVTEEAMQSLGAAFAEVAVTQKDQCDTEELERVLVISLQIALNFLGFDRSPEIYSDHKGEVVKIIKEILNYYENKFVNLKEIDSDLIDIVDSTNTIVTVLNLSDLCDLDKFFSQTYSIWKALASADTSSNNSPDFEDDIEALTKFSKIIKPPLSLLICTYIINCSEENLLKALDVINSDYDLVLCDVVNKDVQSKVSLRSANYRSRLENDDS